MLKGSAYLVRLGSWLRILFKKKKVIKNVTSGVFISAILGRAVSRLYCLTGEWAEGYQQKAIDTADLLENVDMPVVVSDQKICSCFHQDKPQFNSNMSPYIIPTRRE